MKYISLILLSLILIGGSCKNKEPERVPVEYWSTGCVEFAPENGGYKLSGMCCMWLELGVKEFRKGTTRAIKGTYHSFTGAGWAEFPAEATMKVSEAGDKVTIILPTTGPDQVYELTPGRAKTRCDCFCD